MDPADVTPAEDPALDALRADALAARVLDDLVPTPRDPSDGTAASDGHTVVWDRSEADVVVNLVMDLDTLRREADHPVLLDGQPMPAELGRDLAGYARTWRRMVTDPVTGHLLDYGATTYLPAALRTFVLARDGQ